MEIEDLADFFITDEPKPKKNRLRDKYVEPPFSILDARRHEWLERKKYWKKVIGIQSEAGREVQLLDYTQNYFHKIGFISIFDPHLAEVMYRFFCPEDGKILDPFAGGSVRGIVANYLGYNYTGIDIRPEQIDENVKQAAQIIPERMPVYLTGDALHVLDTIEDESFDLVFSCPPYADLEKYSDLPGDISNMNYEQFLSAYRAIIGKSCAKIKRGGYAVFVVGEIRDKKGNFRGFVPDTVKAFQDAGVNYYNELIYVQPIGNRAITVQRMFDSKRKVAKTHQNILVFKKS